jgi:hypothetical protein
MRTPQYRILYAFLSAYTHAAPVAVVGGFAEVAGKDPLADVQQFIGAENHRMAQLAGLSVALFGELWSMCSPPVPAAKPATVWQWMERLKQQMQSL